MRGFMSNLFIQPDISLNMRLFVAVQIPEELKEKAKEVQNKLAGIRDAKMVEAENLHFTLKFLGETGEEKVQEIKIAIEEACANSKAFEMSIAGIDAFPSKNYARAVWLCVKDGLEQMESLMEVIDGKLSLIGFAKEKEHIPHLTLARVRSGRDKAKLGKLLESLEKSEIGKMHVKEVKLIKSTLSRHGPVYEEVHSVKLK